MAGLFSGGNEITNYEADWFYAMVRLELTKFERFMVIYKTNRIAAAIKIQRFLRSIK